MEPELREISQDDYVLIAEIYRYYILNSTATFHTGPVSLDELKSSILCGHPVYKSWMIYLDDVLCGYCYLGPYNKRQAYRRTAELTVYLKPEFCGKGIGKKVIQQIEKAAVKAGLSVLIGIISGDNERSISLFEKCGYEKCAHFRQVGEKFGKILDVVAYQKIL